MIAVPAPLRQRLQEHRQEHVVRWWETLDETARRGLVQQLEPIDFPQITRLYEQRDQSFAVPSPDRIQPIPVDALDESDAALRRAGEEALRGGEVAVLIVAGGQGSRLGFEHPKGMYPIGPVSRKSLFQIHAEKVLALGRRYGRNVPLLIMTSPATHDETVAYFREQRYFGLSANDVFFFCQGTMPALDLASGKLLMDGPGRVFTSPNGHGGTLTALADSGLLARMEQRGVRHIFYFQVDNPLIKVADPLFLGHHVSRRAEVSSKIVPKEGPNDRLGNLVLVDGRCTIIEYSDLPDSLARRTDAEGRLWLWAGSPAIHLFDVAFLKHVTTGPERMPFHTARKKVPYHDDNGRSVQPANENALKFEMFIFDVLPLADRWTVVETSRREEFVPLKNATGADSPAVVEQAISDLAAAWLSKVEVNVPRGVPLEISPLFALDAAELAGKVDRYLRVDGPLYLHDRVTG
jgi:UDP-N-acetylglucosamine/UDP-N-acetylgalactosamine diphosphorylase